MSADETLEEHRFANGMQVTIVGVGGAGNNLLSQAIDRGVSPQSCVAVNTDRARLSLSQARNRVLLSDSVALDGQPSGNASPNLQLLAHRISPFTRESDFTILLAGLGGATATRTAPVIAQLNRTRVKPVVSIVALPFIHERERRFVALRGLKRMVETCDCTVVIDNAVRRKGLSSTGRAADEVASVAVRNLAGVASLGNAIVSRKILSTLALGEVATVGTSSLESNDRVQTATLDAMGSLSADLPLSHTKGAVLVHTSAERLTMEQAAQSYDTIASLVGHGLEFVPVSIASENQSSLSIFLTGYSYGMALASLTDLIEDVYDMEYGIDSGSAQVGIPLRLYQMEGL